MDEYDDEWGDHDEYNEWDEKDTFDDNDYSQPEFRDEINCMERINYLGDEDQCLMQSNIKNVFKEIPYEILKILNNVTGSRSESMLISDDKANTIARSIVDLLKNKNNKYLKTKNPLACIFGYYLKNLNLSRESDEQLLIKLIKEVVNKNHCIFIKNNLTGNINNSPYILIRYMNFFKKL